MKKYFNFLISNNKKVNSSTLYTAMLTFVNLCVALYIENTKQELTWITILIIVLLSVFISFFVSSLIVFCLSENKYRKVFGKCSVVIKYGNLMDNEENVINIIPIDDDYTDRVDGDKIAFSSLHGQFLTYLGDENRKLFKRKKSSPNLGTLINDPKGHLSKFYIFPLWKLEGNKVILDKADYCKRVYTLLDEIDGISNKILVRMPLIGDGNARVVGLSESMQKLEMILFLIKLYDFKKETKIEIILYEKDKKIDLSLLS